MTRSNRFLTLALSAALSLSLLSGCAAKPDASTSSSAAAPDILSSPVLLADVTDPFYTCSGLSGDTVVATAAGQDITAESLLYWLASYSDKSLPDSSATEPLWDEEHEGKTLEQSLLDAALDMATLYVLLPQKAAELELSVSEEYLAENADILTQMETSMGSAEILNHYLWQYPMTRDSFLTLCRVEKQASLIQESLYGENGSERPDDAQVEAYATDELGYAYRAKHILFTTVDLNSPILDASGNPTGQYTPLDAATVAGKKTLAENVLSRLNGSDDPAALFDELMHEYSEDSGLSGNPDGYNAAAGQMVEPFEQAALALELGQYSGIVESTFGYHIILRLPLAETCREDYISYLTNQRYHQWIDEAAPVTTAEFDKLDPSVFYARLTDLRTYVDDELTKLDEELAAAAGSASASSSAPQG